MAERTNWAAALIAYGLGVVGAVQVGRVAPAAEALGRGLGLDLATLGWAVSLITLASALLGLAAGHLVILCGARQNLVFGTVLLAISVLLSALAPNVTVLLAMRIVEGIGYLAIVVAAPTLLVAVASPRDVPVTLGLWGTFFTAGLSLAAITGGWASEELGWRGWYGANAVLLAMAAVLALRMLPHDTVGASSEEGNAPLSRATWLLGAAFFGVTLLFLALMSILPPFLIDVRGFAPAVAGGMTGVVALASIGGSLVYGVLAGRFGTGPVVFVAVVLLVISTFPAFDGRLSLGLGMGFAASAIAAAGVLIAHVFASVPRLVGDPRQIGPANGLIAQIGSIGSLCGPPVVGYLVSASGWVALAAVAAGFAILFLLLMSLAERAVRRAPVF